MIRNYPNKENGIYGAQTFESEIVLCVLMYKGFKGLKWN